MDFTLFTYKNFLTTLQMQGFLFYTFKEFIRTKPERGIVLRHDVDLSPKNSLRTAELEYELGIKGTYYFRSVPESWDEVIILKIHEMGHEIGYHYENMDTISSKFGVRSSKSDKNYDEIIDFAYKDFCDNLQKLRKLVPVSTICMHGSPKSKFDNKTIWTKYSYYDLGIIGEPYFDIDFSSVFYLTDTGRRWDGYKVSVRDKIPIHQERWKKEGLTFHTTSEIIHAAKEGRLPGQIMITVHPQRWTNTPALWVKEFLLQKSKNIIKFLLINIKR